MPSLHIAWAAWCTLALWQISRRRWVRVLAVLYPCVTAFAVLATGNHFLLDILAGLAALALAVLAVTAPSPVVTRWWGRARGLARRRLRLPLGLPRPAYRMSQTCYEVQDQID
jgi:membrane-associated phospholipid phosphatase